MQLNHCLMGWMVCHSYLFTVPTHGSDTRFELARLLVDGACPEQLLGCQRSTPLGEYLLLERGISPALLVNVTAFLSVRGISPLLRSIRTAERPHLGRATKSLQMLRKPVPFFRPGCTSLGSNAQLCISHVKADPG